MIKCQSDIFYFLVLTNNEKIIYQLFSGKLCLGYLFISVWFGFLTVVIVFQSCFVIKGDQFCIYFHFGVLLRYFFRYVESSTPVDAIFGSVGFRFYSSLGFSEYIGGVGVGWNDINSDDVLSNIVGQVLM